MLRVKSFALLGLGGFSFVRQIVLFAAAAESVPESKDGRRRVCRMSSWLRDLPGRIKVVERNRCRVIDSSEASGNSRLLPRL
jgi:hypothetical protein